MPETAMPGNPRAPGRTPPGPHGHFLFGVSRQIQQDPLQFMLEGMQRYGDAVRFRFFLNWYGYLFYHPDHNRHILQDNNHNYTKDHPSFRMLRPLVGNGLLTSDGDFWLQQRRLVQPAFHQRRIATFGKLMTDAAQGLLESWHSAIQEEEAIDVDQEMMRLTLQIVGKALFSLDISGEAGRIGQAFTYANRYIADLSARPFSPVLLRLPLPGNLRLRSAILTLDQVVYEIINQRRRTEQQPDDLLAMLMSARDENTHQAMDDRQLRDEVMTLLLAGHETTANALTWTWYLLSQHPEVQAQLWAELSRVLAGRVPEVADLPNLPYTRMVIEESMRLYPPAYAIGRYAKEEDRVGEYLLPAKSILMLSPFLTHRHPDFWPDPERFEPERFTPECSSSRPRYAYIPFGGGPRQCIGNNFAMLEAQLILATLAQEIQLSLAPGHPVKTEPMITLRPKYEMRMFARRIK